jgi:hypothetical protein
MQFEATLDRKMMAEAGKIVRRWYEWPLFVLRNLYGIGLLGLLIYAVLLNLFSSDPHPDKAGYAAIVLAAFVGVGWWRVRRDSLKEKGSLDKINPVRFNIETDGVRITMRSGSAIFSPWNEFASFREGKSLFLILGTQPKSYQIIPKNGLSAHDVDRLRSYLTAQIVSR